MTTTAYDLLTAFETLPPTDQQQVAFEILRRSNGVEVPSDAYDELGAEILQSYDPEEETGAYCTGSD
jgi:hypothetical protein